MLDKAALDKIIENSYTNFHKEGFDYVCLQRTPMFTLKAYFFDEEHSDIVMPHNHRYDFTSTVLAGRLVNHTYSEGSGFRDDSVLRANKFVYFTPLNGGDGFDFLKEIEFRSTGDFTYYRGGTCHSKANDIHTISVKAGTVLLLTQFADKIGPTEPTHAYRLDSKEPPSLEGLYKKFNEDTIVKRLVQLDSLGIRI
jgi:hypothetical protein